MLLWMAIISTVVTQDYTGAEKAQKIDCYAIVIQLILNFIIACLTRIKRNGPIIELFLIASVLTGITWVLAGFFHSISIGGF